MNGRALLVLAILAFFAAPARAQEDAFAKANQEFAAGHFPEAIQLYETLVRDGKHDAAVFYNLGNAHYRAGDSGQAILNYARARTLEPHHPEAEANLRLVRDKARALELKRNAFDRFALQATTTSLTIVAAVAFWVAVFSAAALFFARRRTGALTGLLALSVLVCAAAVAGIYLRENGPAGKALAVVTAKSTEARLATADNASTVLALPAGSEIKILSVRGDWLYASLPNDLRGWIPAQNAQRVRL